MEQNLPVNAKKVWSLMRVIIFILKKGISKAKFLADVNIMMKRGKIAGKALHNLFFHHHRNLPTASTTFHRHPHHLSFHSRSPDIDEIIINPDHVMKALEMLTIATASPPLPVVKQLRITDSPFLLTNGDIGDGMVDEAAEKFIMRFYDGLRRQK